MIRSFYRNAACVVLVYNISKKDTLYKLVSWLSEARENAHQQVISVLVGNKSDLKDEYKKLSS
jgi:GTPase SAR1 family protein